MSIMVVNQWGEKKIFSTPYEAAKYLEIPYANVVKCCKGQYKTTYGYYFCHVEQTEYDDNKPFKLHNCASYTRRRICDSRKVNILVTFPDRETKKVYSSFTRMCDELQLDERNAWKCLKDPSRYKTCKGYQIEYYMDPNVGVSEHLADDDYSDFWDNY